MAHNYVGHNFVHTVESAPAVCKTQVIGYLKLRPFGPIPPTATRRAPPIHSDMGVDGFLYPIT